MHFKKLLQVCKITQTKLASDLGVSQQLVSGWITGKCQPQIEMIVKLSKILNHSIEDIVQSFSEV